MLKQDLKKVHRDLYGPKTEPELVEVPTRAFLMIDGHGDPDVESSGYGAAVEALYTVAYTLRFALKKAEVIEYPVPPLEGLWWTDEFSDTPEWLRRDEWNWTMMIPQPPQVDAVGFADAVASARRKKGEREEFGRVRFEEFTEGLSAQILHIGPYSSEPETMERLNAFVKDKGLSWTGRHHEIYLSDPRKAVPERMKTILRHGVG
ncbi:GyrI-like domain-containing protein [Stackebrandtia nassauensis]|uniref:GyrI-like small molecule binding domain-containing protein n=1 Tax=Stackebrandtia nassauensis (strain DSM 44728 / CIP 108903 / NRRL B-16338 / NBRC 102104 / LLR-40K-21) TaxID=446470 RepID=D3Q7N7_STANL|nr:GyrI-like domain-containing protein [Stackebrandtia nassauensis]ADD44379.1 conserved hypothetical protein [Stackebrandtia nassauensis DSM 44728]